MTAFVYLHIARFVDCYWLYTGQILLFTQIKFIQKWEIIIIGLKPHSKFYWMNQN